MYIKLLNIGILFISLYTIVVVSSDWIEKIEKLSTFSGSIFLYQNETNVRSCLRTTRQMAMHHWWFADRRLRTAALDNYVLLVFSAYTGEEVLRADGLE